MIRYESSEEMVNDYAFVINPTSEDEKELKDSGYCPFSSYTVMREDDPDFGKREEMWIR